jgi:hypothetical protein
MGRYSFAHRCGYGHRGTGRRALIRLLAAVGAWLCAPAGYAAITIERMALHQFEDGPALAPSHLFIPGESIFFSCRLAGYQMATSGDEQRSVKLAWQLQVSDPAGVALEPAAAGRIDAPVLPQDKNWLPKFLHSFSIPPYAAGGAYRIAVMVKDEVSGAEITSQLEVHVRGLEVEPNDALVARSLRFLRSEDDAAPLDPAVYHAGEMLWARFEITGYKFAEKNHYSVSYGLLVLKEDGEQVFAQPDAAADSKESFYPQRYVPGALSLALNQGVPAGDYTLVVTMRDEVGHQTAEARGKFRVEH